MTKHLVYKTTNLVNGKYYIGVHSCNCKSCSYLGSGVALKAAIKKYGRENFKRETLCEFDTREEAFEYENSIVDVSDRDSYNLCVGGVGVGKGQNHPCYGRRLTNKHLKIISNTHKGKTLSFDTRSRISQKLKGRSPKLSTRLLQREVTGSKIIVDGVVYKSQRHVVSNTRYSKGQVQHRLNSSKYPNFNYLSP